MSLFVSRMALGAAKGATTAGGLMIGSGVAMNAAKRLGMGAFGQTVSSMGGELVGLLGTSAVLEQQVPKASDWTNAALIILTLRAGGFAGRKALGLGKQAFSHLEYLRLVPKLRDVYTKTGKTPQDVLNAIKKDPSIIKDLLSKKPLPDAFAEEARTRMLSGETLSMEELKAYSHKSWARAELLEREGFWVNREVFDAPVALDGKQRYGLRRSALEAEGTFGDRWTSIETKSGEWPAVSGTGQMIKGTFKSWRELGKRLYQNVLGKYSVSKTGETIHIGKPGFQHVASQRQRPEIFKAIPYFPELIKNAFKIGEYNPKTSTAKKANTSIRVIFHAAAVIDNLAYDIQLIARQKTKGIYELEFYDARARGQEERLAGQQLLTIPEGTVSPPRPSLSDVRVADFFRGVKDIIDDIPGAVVNSGAKSPGSITKGNTDVSNTAASKTVAEGPLLGKVETALEAGASPEAKAAKAAANAAELSQYSHLFNDHAKANRHMIDGESVIENGVFVKAGKFTQAKGLSGCHRADHFESARKKYGLEIVEDKPYVNGIKTIDYNIWALDNQGNKLTRYKGRPKQQTLYDPAVHTDEQMLLYAAQAAEKGLPQALEKGIIEFTESSNGVFFRFYIDKNTRCIRDYHPVSE